MNRLNVIEQIKLFGRPMRGDQVERMREADGEAKRLEEAAADLDLECTVLVIGKSGVGKSTLINNLLGVDEDAPVPRHSGQGRGGGGRGGRGGVGGGGGGGGGMRHVTGEVHGVKMHFIDVPGLEPTRSEARRNKRILHAAKRATKKHMPDLVLYVDRLDVPNYDFSDIPLLREISGTFGAAIWWNALIVFTHGGSPAPEDSAGNVANFDYYQNHRGYVQVKESTHAHTHAHTHARTHARLPSPLPSP